MKTESKQRTDENILHREGIEVTLGGNVYSIFPKSISESRKWKLKAKPIIDELESVFNVDVNKTSDIVAAMKKLLFTTVDQWIDLIFEWERDLPKQKILDTATEEEIIEAVYVVLKFAFPLVVQLLQNRGIVPQMMKK